jgi:hypothetical protein
MVGERSDVPAVDVGPARRECGKGLVNKRSEILLPPPSTSGRALRPAAAGARRSDASRGDGAQAEDARWQEALRFAQADAGTSVRHHQIRARIPPVLLRGLENIRNEWSLVTMARNIKRIFALSPPN